MIAQLHFLKINYTLYLYSRQRSHSFIVLECLVAWIQCRLKLRVIEMLSIGYQYKKLASISTTLGSSIYHL
jgi:hypothetical protein